MKIEYALRANNYCKEIVNYLKKMHRHAYFEICTVVSGKAKHVVGEEEFILSTGDILFMPSETFHNILPETDDYYHLDIYMNNSFAEEVCGFYSKEMYSYYVKTKAPVVIKVPDGVRDYILERARYMISLFDTRQNSRAESIYRMLLDACDVAHITKIDYGYEADAYFPNLDENPEWEIVADSDEQTYFDLEFYFLKYSRVKS